jgi:hypothetical protein
MERRKVASGGGKPESALRWLREVGWVRRVEP